MDELIWKRVFWWSLLSVAMVIISPAQTFTTLVSFNGTDGKQPSYVALVQGADGGLYGTTEFGGNTNLARLQSRRGDCANHLPRIPGNGRRCSSLRGVGPGHKWEVLRNNGFWRGQRYSGTIFSTGPGDALTTLHAFEISDGANPLAPLVQTTNGSLYGTTCPGGLHRHGTVFQYTPGAILTTLHGFDGTDGGCPQGGLVQAANGYFYGIASDGGDHGYGTVFSIGPSGTLTTLHNFFNP